MSFWTRHQIFEKNSIVLVAGILVVIAIGGLVEITPLFYLKSTIEKVDGVRPYTPLELRAAISMSARAAISAIRRWSGRCATKSSVTAITRSRPRACTTIPSSGDPSVPVPISPASAAKYSDEWHVTHLANPRAIVPQSVMPGYAFLSRDRSR